MYAEGVAWSVSIKYILACGSVPFFLEPIFYDFFSRALARDRDWLYLPNTAADRPNPICKIINVRWELELIVPGLFCQCQGHTHCARIKLTVPGSHSPCQDHTHSATLRLWQARAHRLRAVSLVLLAPAWEFQTRHEKLQGCP